MSKTIGFRDIYIAPITVNTETTYTPGTPVKLAKAISGKFNEVFSTEKSYADDQLDEIIRTFDRVDIELEVDRLTPEVRQILFGQKFVKGGALGTVNDKAGEFAIAFRAKDSNGKYEFFWYYVCSCESPDERSFETIGDKPVVQKPKLTIVGRARAKDGAYKYSVDENVLKDTDSEAKALLAVNPTTKVIKWFENVVEPIVGQ